MTDKQIFILINDHVATNAFSYLRSLPCDGSYEAIFRKITKDKTLKQLGAIFGVWIKYLSEESGESEDTIHKELKNKFLARIYITEPIGDYQEQWVELLYLYQEAGETEKLERHANRISLSWCSLNQMKAYMQAVENHFQSIGKPLPVIDQYYKHNRGQENE